MRDDFLHQLYQSLSVLKEKQNGYHYLVNQIPAHTIVSGVYFFFDNNILREDTLTLKVMRVGKSQILRKRFKYHKGNLGNGGGAHRNSVFRQHIGKAFILRDHLQALYPKWGIGKGAQPGEYQLEVAISSYIRQLPYLFLHVPNLYEIELIETRSIELLSNSNPLLQTDVPNVDWLGYNLVGEIANSNLWNIDYVNNYQPGIFQRYEQFIGVLNNLIDDFNL